jgi:hypothetical protein
LSGTCGRSVIGASSALVDIADDFITPVIAEINGIAELI